MPLEATHLLALSSPLQLEYMSGWVALLLLAALSLPILWLGMRSLNGLGALRKWVAIGVRLAVLLVFVLILGGARWQREHKDLEVMVLRDVSDSIAYVRDYPADSLDESIRQYLRDAGRTNKPSQDRIGVIGFHSRAWIDAMPSEQLRLDAHAIREGGSGTDVASAIQLALATLSREAMHRLVLLWDGNATQGDLDRAIAAAAAQGVPIDVVPMEYNVQNAVMVERFIAPTWMKENEAFVIDVILFSSSPTVVSGRLSVLHQNELMDMEPQMEGRHPVRQVTLRPGRNVERVRVPAQTAAGVHQFRAIFEADDAAEVTATIGGAGMREQEGTLMVNRTADAFTFVHGRGRVLYVDNTRDGRGEYLRLALEEEGIEVQPVGVAGVPNDVVTLQNYDAVILANVPRGAGGITDQQGDLLAAYVHDMGGGLVMIGGEEAFGAGGWQGSRLEEVLPVNMDIPATRMVGKGALVLMMHSCEMPDGNTWGELCALKAVETLSAQDEVGVICYQWRSGRADWEYELQEKGDGSAVNAAIRKMSVGDFKQFDEGMRLALHGRDGQGGLINSNARQKHVIVISDGDPSPPTPQTLQDYVRNKVTISTITVYPHFGDVRGIPRMMLEMAEVTGGRAYGPINANPNQLPQIFIKEATVVRRSLIHEPDGGIRLNLPPSASEMMRGITDLPGVSGMVLTSRKPNPQIEVPIVANAENDPVLAHWQTGLGKAAAFTSDAHNKWAAQWIGTPAYGKFWAQVVRGVSRPPMSADFDVMTRIEGERGRVTVEALTRDAGFLSFLNIRGRVLGPDMEARDVRLLQTGPGTYSAEFDAPVPGNYVVMLNYQGADGTSGMLLSGTAMHTHRELRDLESNIARVREIAERTGGRVLPAWDGAAANLFAREWIGPDGLVRRLHRSASPMPIWDLLIPLLLALMLMDVAVRRLAWDRESIRRARASMGEFVRSYTVTRKVETRQSLDALRRVREEGHVHVEEGDGRAATAAPVAPRPDPSRKFEAKGVEGDISQLVGGASGDKPIPAAPKKAQPKGLQPTESGSHTGSLLEAKRRARKAIEEREKE